MSQLVRAQTTKYGSTSYLYIYSIHHCDRFWWKMKCSQFRETMTSIIGFIECDTYFHNILVKFSKTEILGKIVSHRGVYYVILFFSTNEIALLSNAHY